MEISKRKKLKSYKPDVSGHKMQKTPSEIHSRQLRELNTLLAAINLTGCLIKRI